MHGIFRVVVGGTFSHLHKGHMVLLRKAFSIGSFVYVGLTSDAYTLRHKQGYVEPYKTRKKELARVLRKMGKPFAILPINDKYGPLRSSHADAIVVSAETFKTAEEINNIRRRKGLKQLRIITVRRVFAEDGTPISSSKIARGAMDRDGRILNVGTSSNIFSQDHRRGKAS